VTDFGVTSMTTNLRRVAVRPPSVRGDYEVAHWAQPLDMSLLVDQHAAFVELLAELGCEIDVLDPVDDMPDAIFTYDPCFVVGNGFIEFQGAKQARAGEPPLLAAELEARGIPRIGRLSGDATADGGDFFWLDDSTLAVGRSYRTNDEAIEQVRSMLGPEVSIDAFDLPHDQGPEFCLHLMSVVSPIRDDLAVVYERLAPVRLLEALRSRGVELLALPDEDYATLGCNVLTVRPGVAVIASGNDATVQLLRNHGVEVHVYEASEISKGEGGPTCLTRPLLRA
jgi:N-dimethylarginine dimethylaminohydrolase